MKTKKRKNQINKLKQSYGEEYAKGFKGKIIFVEGKNDKLIFDSVVNKSWHVSTYANKKTIINYFRNNINKKDQIGIVDADYDFKEKIENIYYTDYNDIESTAINLMNSEEIINSIKPIKCSKEYFEKEVLNPVLDISRKLSKIWRYFRQHNIKEIFITNMNKKEYDSKEYLEDIINIQKNDLRYEKIEEKYFNRKIDYHKIIKERIETEEEIKSFRGHDFFQVLDLYVSNKKITLFEENISVELLLKVNGKKNYKDLIEEKFIENSKKFNWIKRSKIYKEINKKYNCFNR